MLAEDLGAGGNALTLVAEAVYRENDDGRKWWCNSHERWATHVWSNGDIRGWQHCCAPSLGGILLPCFAVDITDEAEIDLDSRG